METNIAKMEHLQQISVNDGELFGREFDIFIPKETIEKLSIDEQTNITIESIDETVLYIGNTSVYKASVRDLFNPQIKYHIYIPIETIKKTKIENEYDMIVSFLY